ncbi:unnamed protein product [Linum trigynum]|uniref:Rieske domain-containing protein n=1 Tax=Linum trigynum TaxID=586398 RepID=A0AAV2DDQ5_9ROSI
MKALPTSTSAPSLTIRTSTFHAPFSTPHYSPTQQPILRTTLPKNSKLLLSLHAIPPLHNSTSSVSAESPPDQAADVSGGGVEKFDWYAQWYPVAPVCDLDKGAPRGLKVMGMDVVVWWDGNENAWKVFDDMCPHRLAPLSEGRIDRWGRLQCSYHGWCFDGSGSCQLIPQAPLDGPPAHTSKRACVATYPTVVHHGIVWFWPNSDPEHRHVFDKKNPPLVPELDDPSFTTTMGSRDIRYGYDSLVENLVDPAHLPYAHYGLTPTMPNKEKRDEEGGRPMEFMVNKLGIDGFEGSVESFGEFRFIAPCLFFLPTIADEPSANLGNGFVVPSSAETLKPSTGRRMALVVLCVPVSPGTSRLIWAFPRNFDIWVDKVVPRWILHMGTNLILDSDLCILHAQLPVILTGVGSMLLISLQFLYQENSLWTGTGLM